MTFEAFKAKHMKQLDKWLSAKSKEPCSIEEKIAQMAERNATLTILSILEDYNEHFGHTQK